MIENIQNSKGKPINASIVGLNFPAMKKEVTAIDVARPDPISLALDGSSSD